MLLTECLNAVSKPTHSYYDWLRELSVSDWSLIRDYGQWAESRVALAVLLYLSTANHDSAL